MDDEDLYAYLKMTEDDFEIDELTNLGELEVITRKGIYLHDEDS